VSKNLFTPASVGRLSVPHRVVMAPLTRQRAGQGNVPTDLVVEYYRQRASAALIVSEATQVSPRGQGYPGTPGIHSLDQVHGWHRVTEAVHAAGGRIFLQLWHVGRISHPSFHGGELPVAPSAVRPAGKGLTADWQMADHPTPRALERSEIPQVVDEFRRGAENALAAGFDGVEIHGANGYLIDQFLRDGTNRRTDDYGGSVEFRARFALEVTDAVTSVWGADRVGIRLSPSGTFNDMKDSQPEQTFGYVVQQLAKRKLAYLHLVEAQEGDVRHGGRPVPIDFFRGLYPGTIIVNSGYDRARADAVIARGAADLVAFGRDFIANPDLPARLRANAPLNPADASTFYGGGAKGYVDYPRLEEATTSS
jgi:N-ethylmaleimide reductase